MQALRERRGCQTPSVPEEFEVDAAAMLGAFIGLPGVTQVALEYDGSGGVLRVRLVGPGGQPVVAAVEPAADPPPADPPPVRPPPSASPPVVWQPLAPSVPPPVTDGPDVPVGDASRPDDGPARLVLERVEVASERVQMWATVHLVRGEARFSGSAGATASGTGPHRAVAAATARAAAAALGADVRLDVEAVDVLAVGHDQVAVVIVTLLTPRGVDRLTGAAMVRDDGRETIVRATLDALNRRAEAHGLERPASRA